MTTETNNANMAAADAQLKAAGIVAGGTIWLPLANGVMAAYAAYQNGTTPSLPGYQVVASISVSEDDVFETLLGFAAYSDDLNLATEGTRLDAHSLWAVRNVAPR